MNSKTPKDIDSILPAYVLEETKLRKNLSLIRSIADEAGVEFILAFKAFALWKTFPIFREYIQHTTASSPYEARMSFDLFGNKAHTYSPAYEETTFGEILRCSSHITFNSLSQFQRFYPLTRQVKGISCGIRINPERSEIETELYDPCAPGSRFGITAAQLPQTLPSGIEGFHCHCHCENDSFALERTLQQIEQKFGAWLDDIRWINLGGGHLVTRKDYDTAHLIKILKDFRRRHPNLRIILEPGSAFAWQTGDLIANVVDIVENSGIKTAILNVSFTCHMPDCLEMPYHPAVEGAEILELETNDPQARAETVYRLGGNSCLSGDWMGYWKFDAPLRVGQRIVLKDMIHYTTVKTNMFNGIHHPTLALRHVDGTVSVLRKYGFEDYKERMD